MSARDELATEVEAWLQECGSCDAGLPMGCTCPKGDYRNILLKVWTAYLAPQPVDRKALAQAAHHYFCIRRSEPNHDPRRSDYDKADEILEILALITGDVS